MAYYIGPRCSACHYCYHECPVGAIRFVGTSYEINEFKCIGCGKCAQVCPSGIIYDPSKVEAPTPHAPQELNCDLVVLGAGGSGMVAAVRAAQLSGKKVIVLEKAKKPGGNTNLGHGFLMRYTKWHEAAGMPDVREEFLNKLYEDTGRTMDYQMLRNATYGLSDMFDWLCTFSNGDVEQYFKLMKPGDPGVPPGIPFAMIDFPQRIDNVKSSDTSMGPGWMGTFVVNKMIEVGKTFGVEVLTEHKAEHLLLDENGAFAGVVASNPGGTVTVHASACIIATGGFAHNDTLMTKTNPDFFRGVPVKRLSVAGSTGDGMALVQEIGGALDLEYLRVPASGPVHHPFNYTVMNLGGFGSPQFDGSGHKVNLMGGPGSPTGPLDSLDGCAVYTVIDSNTLRKNGESSIARNTDPSALESKKNYQYEIDFEASCGYPVRKAWTLEGLAEKINVNPTIFVQEVAKHNAEADELAKNPPAPAGGPGPFGGPMLPEKIEEAPFYAIYGGRFSESASGGIVTNTTLEVVRETGEVIPGIWAVGDSCKGLFQKDDRGGKFGEMPWAMASGYLAGCYAGEALK